MDLRTFPSIEQFRHVVRDVRHYAEMIGLTPENKAIYDVSRRKPVLKFRGTVKLHGTNGGVALDLLAGTMYAQSRERILTPEDDNCGFATWAQSESGAADIAQLRESILAASVGVVNQQIISLRLFGEWCGLKVNGKTAIGQLPLRWVLFESALLTLADGTEQWVSTGYAAQAWQNRREAGSLVYFIDDYERYEMEIDFNDPEAAVEELERLTLEVEASCPVAKSLGGEGIGEGIVWVCQDPVFGRLVFKTKGSKHKGTKNSRLVQIEPEVLASMEQFTEAVLTDSRLEQGFELLQGAHGIVTEDHIGAFLAWIGRDVLKEESDTLEASGLERKQVMGRVNHRAKNWLISRLSPV